MKIKFKNKFLKMPRREFEAKRAMGQIPPADIKKWYKANGREAQAKNRNN